MHLSHSAVEIIHYKAARKDLIFVIFYIMLVIYTYGPMRWPIVSPELLLLAWGGIQAQIRRLERH